MQTNPIRSLRHGIATASAIMAAFFGSAAQASEAWRNVLPAGAPGCSQGTPYSFWAREGDPKKLAVILSGGGACWSGENCALHGKSLYRSHAGLEQDPTRSGGVFDTDNPENPLKDYTLVFLPTCNGDVFLGDAVATYDVPAVQRHSELPPLRHQELTPGLISCFRWLLV